MDPRLCLIRLRHVSGNPDLALVEAQDRFCSIFDNWPRDEDDGSLQLRFMNLAQTLNVLDKNSDAVAAWQARMPEEQQEPKIPNAEVEGVDPPESHVRLSESSSATPHSSFQELSCSVDDVPKAYIWDFFCDGGCETRWKNMLIDCYVCKHCLAVHLCSSCFNKLQDGELSSLICNKDHKMLYLPPFDQSKQRIMLSDMVIVDGQPVPRSQWLNKIRDEFGMQQEQIDMIKLQKARELKAASRIAMHVLKLQNRFKKKRPG